MGKYTPRRQSARWLDTDCPAGVLAIFDHPDFADRYTVFYKELDESPGRTGRGASVYYRGMSEAPNHPQGIGQMGEMQAYEVAQYRYANGHRKAKWSSLPEAVRACVRRDLTNETESES